MGRDILICEACSVQVELHRLKCPKCESSDYLRRAPLHYFLLLLSVKRNYQAAEERRIENSWTGHTMEVYKKKRR